jgi:hypothetical protein
MTARSGPLLVGAALILFTAHRLLAGGSIGWDDARTRIRRYDPDLVAWVEQTFDVRVVGAAVRVGRQADGRPAVEGAQIGDRLPPFEFPAKPKGSSGAYTLYLTFDYSGHKHGQNAVWQVSVRRNVFRD